MREVCLPVAIDFKHPEMRGAVFLHGGVKHENAGLDANGGLDVLLDGGIVAAELSRIDVDLGYLTYGCGIASPIAAVPNRA
jgi:hypothetical protein